MKIVSMFNYLKVAIAVLILITSIYLPVSVSAAGTAIVSISAPTQPVSSGSQFTVSISVQPNNSIAGVQSNISFNPSLVTINSVSEGNLLKQNGASTYFNPGQIDNNVGTISGVVGVIATPGQTVSTSGTFAVITLTAGSNKGTCPLNLSNVVIGDINGQAVSVNTSNGQVIIDQPPILNAIGNKSVNEGNLLTFTISGTDPDGDTITYSASNLPSGSTFDPATRTFSWTPNFAQASSYPNVHFQVSDGTLTASENITITINNINQPAITTDAASNINTNGATLNGNLISIGSDSAITVSFEYGLNTSYGNTVEIVPATLKVLGAYNATISGLEPNTLYHYRTKAVGSVSIYGVDQTFTTLASESTLVEPKATFINWSVLLIVISIGFGVSAVLICILVLNKRRMYNEGVIEREQKARYK